MEANASCSFISNILMKNVHLHTKKSPAFQGICGRILSNLTVVLEYCTREHHGWRQPECYRFYPLWGSETFSESVTMTCVISVPQVCPRGGGSGIPTGYLFPLGREFDNSMWLGGREDCQGSLRGLRDEWKNKWSTAISAGDFFQFSRVDVLKVFCFYVDFNHFFFCYSPLLDIYPMGREIWLTLT